MKLGINSGIWEITGIKLEDAAYRIKDFGFNFVDVLAVGSSNPLYLTAKDKNRILKIFQKKDLTASNMVAIPTGNIASSNQEEKEMCMKYLKSCALFQSDLGGKQILIGHGGGELKMDMEFEKAWVNSLAFLKEFCEYLDSLNMILTLELEPMVFYMINNTYRMLKMIEDVNMPNIFANIDIGHLAITRESPQKLGKLKDYIMHAHISDCDGMQHENLIIGTGAALIRDYLIKLINMDLNKNCQKHQISMVAALELGVIGQNIEDLDSYINKSIDYVINNVAELSF